MSADVSPIDSDPRSVEVTLPATQVIAAARAMQTYITDLYPQFGHTPSARIQAYIKRFGPATTQQECAKQLEQVVDEYFYNWSLTADGSGEMRAAWGGGDGEGEIEELMTVLAPYLTDESEVRFATEYGDMYGYQVKDKVLYHTQPTVTWQRKGTVVGANGDDEDEDEDEDEAIAAEMLAHVNDTLRGSSHA